MTDLLLCNPYFIKDDPVTRGAMDIYPLLGHSYLASYLDSHGYSVEVFDATFEKGPDAYFDALASIAPGVVGVYGHLLSRDNAFAFARAAKERGLLTVAGGPDATGYYDDYLGNGFDIVVRSEGEETAREVMHWYRSGAEPAELQKILGIAYRTDDGKIALNGTRPWIKDLDALPFPRRDEHVHRPYMDNWRRVHGYASLPIFAARGCPFDCAFCYRPVFGKHYRMRSPENIVAEIDRCIEQFGVSHFRFVDDTFVVKRQWVKEVAGRVRERGWDVSFDVLSRADLMNDDVAADLKSMGVRRVYFGMESGSDRVLQRMSKRLTAEKSVSAARSVRSHGMEFLTWAMLGYPGETKEDVYLTGDFLAKIKPDVVSISIAFPIRDTPFYDEVKDRIEKKRPLWRRTGENRLVFSGRYPRMFYRFAQRALYKEVELAKGEHSRWARPAHHLLKWLYRLGMEAFAMRRPPEPAVEEGGEKKAERRSGVRSQPLEVTTPD